MVGHIIMQNDSMLTTTSFGLRIKLDSNHPPLASHSSNHSCEMPLVGVANHYRNGALEIATGTHVHVHVGVPM